MAGPEHVVVYYERGRFGGWPANHGIWNWGNEFLVGFSKGFYKDRGSSHHIDPERPERHMLARSMDGGGTWTIEDPNAKGFLIPQGASLHGTELPGVPIPEWTPCPGKIGFTHPDFAITFRMINHHHGPSRFYYSYDRGHTWKGPYIFPCLGTPGVAARTDYIVDGPSTCLAFLTAGKPNGREGRPFCARTEDGGLTWKLASWLMPELGPDDGFGIMPSGVRLSGTELIACVRRRLGSERWIAGFRSRDNAATWAPLPGRIAECGTGNPPCLIKLSDGRLCVTYGYRAEPFSIRVVFSSDGGETWTEPVMLRDDGACGDLGYVRSLQRPDGKVVSTYYFSDRETGPERYIGATIWDPAEYV